MLVLLMVQHTWFSVISPKPNLKLHAPCLNFDYQSPTVQQLTNNLVPMAPRSKRKRQPSHTSSSVRTSQSLGSQRGRFKRPSVSAQPSSQRGSIGPSHHSQTTSHCHHTPRDHASSQPQSNHATDNEEVNEDLEQVVMAIDRQQKGIIGCAYYTAREEKLYCLQDVINGTMEAIETCESFRQQLWHG